MPVRLLLPLTIVWGTYKAGEWIYTQVRLHHSNFHREFNGSSSQSVHMHDQLDKPPARKIAMGEKQKKRNHRILYEDFLGVGRHEDIISLIDEDPKTRDKPKYTTQDITLKSKILRGEREKDKYNYDDIVELPFYYKRWRDRTKQERDNVAEVEAAQGPIVYGAPYWKGIKADDI